MSIALTLALVGIFTGYAESVAAGQMVLVYGFNSDRLEAIFENNSTITNWMTAFLSLASFTTITISAAIGESWFYWPYLAVSFIFGMCTGKIGSHVPVEKDDKGRTDVTLPYLEQYFALIASVLFAFGHVFAQTDDSALILASIGAGCSFISDGIVTSSGIFEKKLNPQGSVPSVDNNISIVRLLLCSSCYVASAVGFSLTESAGIIATVTWVFQCINFLKKMYDGDNSGSYSSPWDGRMLWILKLLLVLVVPGLAVTSVSIGGKHDLFDTTSVDLGIAALSLVIIQNTIEVVELF